MITRRMDESSENDMSEDPYTLLRKLEGSEEDGDLLGAAITTFDPLEPEGLNALLLADDPVIRRRGLFVFGELGLKGFVVLDAALNSVDDPSVYARSGLMNGVISYPKKLSSKQAQIVLRLADDPEDSSGTRSWSRCRGKYGKNYAKRYVG